MDPTLAHTMRVFLAELDRTHTGEPVCACGDELPEGRAQHLLDAIAAAFLEPDLAPHVVHVEDRFETAKVEKVQTEDDDPDDPRKKGSKVTGRRYIGPTDCPDCRRGLSSRGFDMICARLSTKIELKACHEGCLVACGEGLTDG